MKKKPIVVLAACVAALAAAGGASAAFQPGTVGVDGTWDYGAQVSNAQGTTPDLLHQGLYERKDFPGNGDTASNSFTVMPLTGCDPTGCGTWQGSGYGAAQESLGQLSGDVDNELSVDNAQSGFGGTSYVRTHGTIQDTVTLSQAATVHIVGTIQGSISSTNDTGGEYSDPAPDASVSIGFLARNPLCRECGWSVDGYTNDFGVGRPNESFDIPVDLPAGDSSFVADLELDSGNFLLDGPATHEELISKIGFFVVQFHVVAPDGVTVTSASGHLPVVGGAPIPPADTTAPVTAATAPAAWTQGPATVSLDATDGGSGVASITYSATGANPMAQTTVDGAHVDIPVTAEGVTTITYAATDKAGNVEAPQTVVVRIDDTAPLITTPGDITVDATSSQGASVSYSATVWDAVDPQPAIDCTPASGSLFAIGVTKVTCTALDEAGNTSTATFDVTVRSALEMTGELPSPGSASGALVSNVQRQIERGNTHAAIALLEAYINVVSSPSAHRDLTQAQIDAAIALARQIIAVLGG
jgi:hypothetical protein